MVGLISTVLKPSSEPVKLQDATATMAAVVGTGMFGVIGGAAAGGTAGVVGLSLTTVTVAAAAAGAVKGGWTGYDAAEGAADAVKSEAQSFLDKAKEVADRLLQRKSEQYQNLE